MKGIRRSWKWLLLLALAGAFFARARLARTPVIARAVTLGDVTAEVLGTGTLEARVSTTLSPRIQERLAEVLVDQGDAVSEGQLLARLDDGELRQQVAVAEAVLAAAKVTVERVRADQARAEAILRQAQLDHQRMADLLATKVTAQAEFDKAAESLNVAQAELRRTQAAIAEAESQVFTAEKNLLYQRERLSFTELRSPYHGLVVRRDRDPGGVVVPGASILQLAATNEIWVTAWVDETASAALQPGQPARVRFRSVPDHDYAGTVVRLGRETDRETREFLVDVQVDQLPPNWTLGQRAEVYIHTERRSGVVRVPEPFLVLQGGAPGVFVADGHRARWRLVTLGLRGNGMVEVREGLAADQQVVRPRSPQSKPLADGVGIALP